MYQARLEDKNVRCGKCGHKIAEAKGLKQNLGRGTIYIKCKHKSAGKRCDTINVITL